MEKLIQESIRDSIRLKETVLTSCLLLELLERVSQETIQVLRSGGKVLLCGNGGSAADAQHLAAEFVSRFRFDRPALAAVALNCNASVLTGVGNDYAYDQVFKRQVEALGQPGDMLWAFSSTGNSENICLAMEAARARGMRTVGFLGGSGGICLKMADDAILVPSTDTPRVQECHIMMGHILCDCVEQAIFGE